MMTVHEVSELTGVSIRTLQYYDRIGLLPPAAMTGSGYRLYDENSLETLQQILLFRTLKFPLKEIREIICSPAFDREKALKQQIELLTLEKEHIEELISLARRKLNKETTHMSFEAFDTAKLDEYAKKAKESWGDTAAYREYEHKSAGRSQNDVTDLAGRMMDIFREFGKIREKEPSCAEAQTLVRELQEFITEHYYSCTNEILSGLRRMYAAGGEFTENIDAAGGSGTAAFAAAAIDVYCKAR